MHRVPHLHCDRAKMDAAKVDSTALMVIMAAFLLTINFTTKPNQSSYAFAAQLAGLVGVFAFWSHVTGRLSMPTSDAIANRRKRLQAAIPHAGNSGLTENWYEESQAALGRISRAATVGVMIAAIAAVCSVYPDSPLSALAAFAQTHWDHVRTTFPAHHIYIVGGLHL